MYLYLKKEVVGYKCLIVNKYKFLFKDSFLRDDNKWLTKLLIKQFTLKSKFKKILKNFAFLNRMPKYKEHCFVKEAGKFSVSKTVCSANYVQKYGMSGSEIFG